LIFHLAALGASAVFICIPRGSSARALAGSNADAGRGVGADNPQACELRYHYSFHLFTIKQRINNPDKQDEAGKKHLQFIIARKYSPEAFEPQEIPFSQVCRKTQLWLWITPRFTEGADCFRWWSKRVLALFSCRPIRLR
jgi:hypothetical protein